MSATTTASVLSPARTDQLLRTYRDGLLQDTVPFWLEREASMIPVMTRRPR